MRSPAAFQSRLQVRSHMSVVTSCGWVWLILQVEMAREYDQSPSEGSEMDLECAATTPREVDVDSDEERHLEAKS